MLLDSNQPKIRTMLLAARSLEDKERKLGQSADSDDDEDEWKA